MSLRIRLSRIGERNNPLYRIVVAPRRAPRDGKHVEVLGSYNPAPSPNEQYQPVSLNFERTRYWLANGAEPSERMARILYKAGLIPPLPKFIPKFINNSKPGTSEKKNE